MSHRSRKPWDARLAALLVQPLVRTPVTPNMLTTVRLLLGLAGAWLLAGGTRINAGAWLLFASSFVDHADGELARLSGKTSRIGHLYDLACDGIVTVCMFVGIGLGLASTLGPRAIAMGAIAGIAVAAIFHMRYVIEETIGKAATTQPGVGGFEAEDVLYLFPLVTLTDVLPQFLAAASIGAPLAALIVGAQLLRLRGWKRS